MESITEVLSNMKKMYEEAIATGGREQATSLIRSQKLIGCLHEYLKGELVKKGIDRSKIYPQPGFTKPEITMTGYLKRKAQDISVLPVPPREERIEEGVLIGEIDYIGKKTMNNSISINVRSQLSSLLKNFDTLIERTFAEPLNLHLRAPKLVMGEVYMVPLVAYDPDKMLNNEVGFKEGLSPIYISMFQALNNRKNDNDSEYKYERACLLVVDFRDDPPKIIHSIDDFVKEGLIKDKDSDEYSLDGLGIEDFISDILKIYEKRHGSLDPLRPEKKLEKFFG